MKTVPCGRTIRRFLALAATPAFCVARAQTPEPKNDVSAPVVVSPSVPVVLSPFEVQAERDVGFVAASSLAGGRMASDLKDTPVAYSVLTKEFLDALQLNDLVEMVKWAPNSYDLADNNQTYDTGNQVGFSSRGVSSGRQRNFFPYNSNFDSYNIERLDLARGPNAVLFGASGVGGVANSVTKRARTEKQFTEVRVSYGSWENFRAMLDHNQPLGQRLSVRVNALYHDSRGWRDYDLDRRKGLTIAGTWKPFRNTEIRGEYEIYDSAKAVFTTNYDDNISGWNGTAKYSARISAANNAAGVAPIAARQSVFSPSNGANRLINYEGWAITQGGNATAAVPAGGTIVVGPNANIVNASIIYSLNLPANLYDLVTNNSKFTIPTREASTFGSGPNFLLNNRSYTLELTQRIGDHFFAEIAGNISPEDTDGDIGISRSFTKVYLDVNSVLPTGESNPNFLEPFSQSQSYPYLQYRESKNSRLALGYILNGTRWGGFQFNVIAGTSDNSFDRNAYRYMLKVHADPRQWPTFSPVLYRYYLNTDKDRPMPQPDTWSQVDPITNTTSTVAAGNVRDYTNVSFNQLNDTKYGYAQAAVSAKLFRAKLNLLGAVRRDRYETHQDSIVLQFDNPTDWDGFTRTFKPSAPSDYLTLTYRERDANGNPFGAVLPADIRPRTGGQRDSRYASDRFRDDYSPPDQEDTVDTFTAGAVYHVTKNVSVFVNYAQSFAPPSSAQKIDGSLFVAQASEGWDYGLRFTLLDGGMVANVIRYTGLNTGRSISSTPLMQNFNAIIQANALNDLTSGGLNSRGLLPLPTGYVDSADVETEGWELDVTANITKNWRLILNAGLPDAIQTNPNKESLAYHQNNEATLKQIVIDAGGTIDANNVATFTAAIPPGQSPTEGPNAVTAWNGNQAAMAALASGQKLNRLTEGVANLYTDYRFSTGILKGLRIGAGVNYRGRQVIGSKGADTIRNPANPSAAVDDPSVGAFDYVYMDEYYMGTLTFNYRRKLGNRYTLDLDLKVDNLFDYDKPIYVNTILHPAGGDLTNPARVTTPNRFSWLTPRNFTFTASFKF